VRFRSITRSLLALAALVPAAAHADPPRPRPACTTGEYADDLSVLVPRAREFERQPYSYAVRNTATYECLSYSGDGNLKRSRKRAVMHGTAFAYKQVNGETLLLTNQHIAEWPAVTDEERTVDGVPPGCKKLADQLRIVDGESDAYERDDIPLSRVVADAQLDVAILKSHTLLNVLPWKVGRSAGLRERNVVEVRGFPLGAFQATNVGKVTSAYDRDTYHEWDHEDFVVDALLSSGNSGSPVLAVSCRTGEFELVGVYHAGYSEGSAMNVVVGIDQVRDMMTTLKRSPRGHADGTMALAARDRAKLQSATLGPADSFFPFGPLTAVVQRRSDGALLFQVMSREFPLKAHPLLVLEDLPPQPAAEDSFGDLGRAWFGNPAGLKSLARSELDADTQALLKRILDGLRRDAVQTFALRAAAATASSRERFDQMSRSERALKRQVASRRDQAQSLSELAERLSPHGNETPVGVADAFAVPAPGAPAPPVVGKK
jgi:S1-C subfamily serine protease